MTKLVEVLPQEDDKTCAKGAIRFNDASFCWNDPAIDSIFSSDAKNKKIVVKKETKDDKTDQK